MNIEEHTQPEKLEKYSFFWSIARLIIASVALFLGGIPPVTLIISTGLVNSLLTLCWIVSGLASAYLVYVWYKKGQTVFGGKKTLDLMAFWIMIITGFNLGIAGIAGTNIGMSITMNKIAFIITGIIYLLTAGYLIKRYKESGKGLF